MTARSLVVLLFFGMLIPVGCSKRSPRSPTPESTVSQPPVPAPIAGILETERRTLQSAASHLAETAGKMQKLAAAAPWRNSGFFDAQQQDQIEGLLFRYLACREALCDLAHFHRKNDGRYPDSESYAKSCIIAVNARFVVLSTDALVVQAFRDDAVAVAKLNEEFYRSRIPKGTFDRLLLGVTNEHQLKALGDAYLLFSHELVNPKSSIARVVKDDATYGELLERTRTVAVSTGAAIQRIIDTESSLLPSLADELRHTRVAELLRDSKEEAGDVLYAARAHLFKGVSRIKNPESHLIKFSDEQKRQVYDALKPGDIILTYTAGYISDIFIPGNFKHAITFVGSPADRQAAGLAANNLAWLPDAERDVLIKSLATERVASGQNADVIEAVGEGVIFNNLGHIMDTHINRLLVLRPQINNEERTKALANVFLFLGDGYDFKFDFADASRQVCTEVVYRALNGKGPIEFSLTKRAGQETLSADDVANAYLASPATSFEFILFAEEAAASKDHDAKILTGNDGVDRLTELMKLVEE